MSNKEIQTIIDALKPGLILHFVALCAGEECMYKLMDAIDCIQDDVRDGIDISIALLDYFEYEKKLVDEYSTNQSS